MKKILSLLLAAVMMASVLAGCGSQEQTPSGSEEETPVESSGEATGSGVELKFSTGGDQGTYYGFGSVLAQAITSSGTGTKVTAVTSNGSQDNIEQMQMNTRQLGFVQSDVMSYAYEGTNLFEGMPVTDFSTVAALYMEQVQIVTCNPDIKTVADLKGKTVSIGASGSGVYYNALDILAAYDMTESDINAQYQDFGNSADALQDGKIDAAFVVAGAPTVAITTLATSKDTYLVSLDDEHIAKLKEASPYYEEYTIPEGTYEGVPETKTVAVVATIIARDDVSENDVYNIVSTIFENKDTIAQSHDKGKELDLEFAASVTAVPYHPGAAKYFAEKGIEVPTK
ncbi:TAXI family TRAP transporter solute-binding subunit [uncultured Oscillibacter sp.]|uniref:TAXI family TRAP transporter solute-binding subunit n=1 Tax=uncultured Oscillibacter sp. TaxID=876091 RepID=UPI0025DDBE62|nr:TAXI family TRAP transporter solute-binding subunit [uncultured Oscillibacter sp.]